MNAVTRASAANDPSALETVDHHRRRRHLNLRPARHPARSVSAVMRASAGTRLSALAKTDHLSPLARDRESNVRAASMDNAGTSRLASEPAIWAATALFPGSSALAAARASARNYRFVSEPTRSRKCPWLAQEARLMDNRALRADPSARVLAAGTADVLPEVLASRLPAKLSDRLAQIQDKSA